MKKGTQNLAIAVVAVVAILVIVGMAGNATFGGAAVLNDDVWDDSDSALRSANVEALQGQMKAFENRNFKAMQRAEAPDVLAIITNDLVNAEQGKVRHAFIITRNNNFDADLTNTMLDALRVQFGMHILDKRLSLPFDASEARMEVTAAPVWHEVDGIDEEIVKAIFGQSPLALYNNGLFAYSQFHRESTLAADLVKTVEKDLRAKGTITYEDRVAFMGSYILQSETAPYSLPRDQLGAWQLEAIVVINPQGEIDLVKSTAAANRAEWYLTQMGPDRFLSTPVVAPITSEHPVVGLLGLAYGNMELTAVGAINTLASITTDALVDLYGYEPGGQPY